MDVKEGRLNLYEKTKKAFQYLWEHHRDEAEWFMKADDDTFVIVENLRYKLSANFVTENCCYTHFDWYPLTCLCVCVVECYVCLVAIKN